MHRLSLLIGEILIKLKLRTVWFWLYLSGKLRQELNHKEDSVNVSIVYHTHVLIDVHVSYCNWIYQIRQEMNKKVDLNGQFLIIDSFPVPVCQPIRNYRAKIFRGYANIGYKATKKIYFYGFKVHAIVSDDGYILDYVVTKASVHDARETVELMENTHPSNYYLLGDEGYLGKELHQQLKQMGYELWTPYRKNMTGAKKHNDHQLMAIRRTIESDFSLLTYYNAENNRARSLIGFQSRLEIAILAYNLAYCLERFN